MKEMVNIVPLGSCPKCGHKQFVVSEYYAVEYLTNPDGEIIDSNDTYHDAKGMCVNCNSEFTMYPTREGFIPVTKLRAIMLDYTPHAFIYKHKEEDMNISNPMEVN